MRICIISAPEDVKSARRLAGLIDRQPAYRSDPDHSITVQTLTGAVATGRIIDQNPLVVFLLSPDAVRVPWLAAAVELAAKETSQRAARLVVVATLRPYTADARLEAALRDTHVIEGGLRNLAIQIAYYSTFRFVQTGGARGFRPTTPPPDLEPEPAEPDGAPPEGQTDGMAAEEADDGDDDRWDAPAAPPGTPPQPGYGDDSWMGDEQERAYTPPSEPTSAPQPPAPQPAAPPLPEPPGMVGGIPVEEEPVGGVLPPPAPYPQPEQQDRQDQRKEAPQPRSEAAPSSGSSGVDASALQFSAYHPNTVAVSEWQTLIVYTYLAGALAQIQSDAATFTELGSAPTVAKGQASRQVEKGVELTVEPHMEGVTFSPERETFIWRGDWRRTLFRFSGAADLAGREQRGWIDIYAGPMVPVARIDLTFPFHDDHGRQLAVHPPRGMIVSSNIYDAVFISYSHQDGEAFRQACDEYERFGVTVYTDEQLEAGAQYEQVLSQRIAEANVFHLLWSPHSAASVECHKEWMAALQREPSERFIKPWFWRRPLSAPPAEFVAHHISFKYEPLRRSFWRPSTWFA